MSKPQLKQENPNLRITRRQHRAQKIILVQFSYSQELYQRCKQLGGRYTRTHKGWWWPVRELTEGQLHKKLGVATSSPDQKKEIGRPRAGNHDNLPIETGNKILKMERWMKQKRYSENTIGTYLSFVRQFFKKYPDRSWDAITKDLISHYNYEEFIAKRKAYGTQNQWINAIKIYLKVHGLDHDGLQNIERPHKSHYLPDVLTPEEVKAIFRLTINLKHRTLLMLIYSCGLRIGEALELKPDDIQSKEGLIYIRGGKGQKDRRVPLSDRILQELRQYYQRYQPSEYLFEGQKGGKYSNSSAAQVLKRAVQKAGISKSVTLHTLRHSYATHLINNGVNIQYLQEILGHKSPKTTMIYTHLSGKDIRSIRSPLDDMDV